MTPAEVETAARQQYNAVGDTNWSQSEIMTLIYGGCLEMARDCKIIERTYSTTTVASQQEYSFPTNTIGIKRITYNGRKLVKTSFKEDDYLTGNNQASTGEGDVRFYQEWNETIYLRPIPPEALTLKLWCYVEPQAVTTTSTLEVPTQFHLCLVDYVLSRMYAKDKDFASAKYFRDLWDLHLKKAMAWQQKRTKADAFAAVQDEESMANTILGGL